MYHGWSDSALSANATTDYVDQVYERDQSAREDLRLFMMPGVLHCFGGKGPSRVDWLDELDGWKKSDQAPSELTAEFLTGGGARKLCAWPKHAVFQGGDDRDPASYRCE